VFALMREYIKVAYELSNGKHIKYGKHSFNLTRRAIYGIILVDGIAN